MTYSRYNSAFSSIFACYPPHTHTCVYICSLALTDAVTCNHLCAFNHSNRSINNLCKRDKQTRKALPTFQRSQQIRTYIRTRSAGWHIIEWILRFLGKRRSAHKNKKKYKIKTKKKIIEKENSENVKSSGENESTERALNFL